MIVISPHLDDGVFSCGRVLAGNPGATVITVCAGTPDVVLSAYDRDCGFGSSAEAVEARRAEDRTVAAVLGHRFFHCAVLDGQYQPVERAEAQAAIASALKQIDDGGPVLVPLGLGHPDHVTVSDAALRATHGRVRWIYEELPYRVVDPDAVAARLDWLRKQGTRIGPAETPWTEGPLHLKEAAVACYRSQRLTDEHSIFAPERYHAVR